ncbi:MAG: hypothetical protein J6C42_09370 [Clostridia bacterium]|nr:hypothetical protein [Clostridia bacterium]
MIRVFDEAGNEVNPTYPKRARGLVKQGRARWADDADDVIVLTSYIRDMETAYPSEVHILEDTEMFEDTNGNEETIETAEETETIEETGLPLKEELNRLYGFENIDKMFYNVIAMGSSFLDEMNIVEQIKMNMASYKTMCQYLNDQLRCSRIGMDEYRAEMEKVQSVFDYRMDQLRGALNALKQGE